MGRRAPAQEALGGPPCSAGSGRRASWGTCDRPGVLQGRRQGKGGALLSGRTTSHAPGRAWGTWRPVKLVEAACCIVDRWKTECVGHVLSLAHNGQPPLWLRPIGGCRRVPGSSHAPSTLLKLADCHSRRRAVCFFCTTHRHHCIGASSRSAIPTADPVQAHPPGAVLWKGALCELCSPSTGQP